MIVDSSALIAIIQGEPGAHDLLAALQATTAPAISSATLTEASIVADGSRDPVKIARFDDLVAAVGFDVVPLTATQAALARQAYRDFGRGSGHPARLNLGDCFTYALAKERREPVLYVGEDFSHTDLASALGGG
ncbi:type II toxin-antitoxin system VapC family toxin [Microbacterium terricola]|uniref:type II toxin-antitoxin system VapC family toxin n=1 Tax=Microbacterium terricola TaxID=344163 RepID=UPI0021E6ECBB|nr:type II toxin-antitoxin system VapC family toxin [Microbacterium terricola]UYK39756.1 type II toxin-antitoxin system VapC family toxin [Microbacterium terricola]